jgi:hypothetical protein
LGVFFDSQLNWRRHISEVKERAAKKTEPSKMPFKQILECRSKTLLRVHQMIVLCSLEYRCNVYGAAQLKRLEHINNQGLRIAIGAFCINKTENLLCEAGMIIEE